MTDAERRNHLRDLLWDAVADATMGMTGPLLELDGAIVALRRGCNNGDHAEVDTALETLSRLGVPTGRIAAVADRLLT
jgi:hypothetical protein